MQIIKINHQSTALQFKVFLKEFNVSVKINQSLGIAYKNALIIIDVSKFDICVGGK